MITIIDYGAGNLFSVKKALEYFNADVQISDNGKIILKSDGIILPGVGAFGAGI
ncbi:MAG TPA: imidazole glycerol phosphate synthase subunit HisH, partial [bacterium]|nr:imidazole glycerol phosphate synthase subunit HisH [bacterium]